MQWNEHFLGFSRPLFTLWINSPSIARPGIPTGLSIIRTSSDLEWIYTSLKVSEASHSRAVSYTHLDVYKRQDDAFQHRYVKPGLSILLTDYHRLFCDDTLLPAGRLRESVNGKNRAQIVIVTKCPQDIKPIDYNIITKRLNLYPYQQLYFSSFRYGNLQPVFPSANSEIDSTVNELPLSALTNTDILLVTGLSLIHI